MELKRYRIEVNGIVQGVGFRPFVYKLADALLLKGVVQNTAGGVLIEIEGGTVALEAFTSRLTTDAPPLARIDAVKVEKLEYQGYKDFSIIASGSGKALNTLISPDISICDDCSREMFDSADHRYLYPFVNCTNCGPRFTIICDVPYDRHNTTMKDFEMCPVCSAQYKDPDDRRYHAQPVCCQDCGPELFLLDAGGKAVDMGNRSDEGNGEGNSEGNGIYSPDLAARTAQLLAAGRILAIKGIGGYHLVCDASDSNAVDELRRRKYRDEKPFALMARDLETVQKYCYADETGISLLLSPARPIVLLPRKPDSTLPEQLAPGNPSLGVMLPYTPLHLLLFFNGSGKPAPCPEMLVMTSGNKSNEPICYDDADAIKRLKGIADYFLTNNRPIRTRTDDSVVRAFRDGEYFIRRSRGYAPAPVTINTDILPADPPSVLALGGEMKNTFCITKVNNFFVSQHIGDLENLETLQAFEGGIEHYKRLFDISPTIAAHDLHPAYLSTEYAYSLKDAVKVPVQHHHAHIASCMAENNLSGEVIGVAFDGTGYGEDGNIWGGELFTGSYEKFERAAHLEYFRLPGSEAAVREPWRVAAACLHQSGYDIRNLDGLHRMKNGESHLPGGTGDDTAPLGNTGGMRLLSEISTEQLELVAEMLEKGFNSPLTSSMGRLFDAVAALTGIRCINGFEGQAAMDLENAASGEQGGAYGYHTEKRENSYVIEIKEIIEGIMADLAAGVAPGIISARFHETIACLVEDTCCRLRGDKGLEKVVLSGGVFQNMQLLSSCMDKLQKRGFQVYIHRKVPTNDGGISLGQAVIAMARAAII